MDGNVEENKKGVEMTCANIDFKTDFECDNSIFKFVLKCVLHLFLNCV